MFALHTNLLIYAHNEGSAFHEKSAAFVKKIATERNEFGQHVVGIPHQIFAEFINVITRQTIEKPMTIAQAMQCPRRLGPLLPNASFRASILKQSGASKSFGNKKPSGALMKLIEEMPYVCHTNRFSID